MAKGFLDINQTVGFNPNEKTLVVTLSSKMANAMKKEGWDISFDREVGHFITIQQE